MTQQNSSLHKRISLYYYCTVTINQPKHDNNNTNCLKEQELPDSLSKKSGKVTNVSSAATTTTTKFIVQAKQFFTALQSYTTSTIIGISCSNSSEIGRAHIWDWFVHVHIYCHYKM